MFSRDTPRETRYVGLEFGPHGVLEIGGRGYAEVAEQTRGC